MVSTISHCYGDLLLFRQKRIHTKNRCLKKILLPFTWRQFYLFSIFHIPWRISKTDFSPATTQIISTCDQYTEVHTLPSFLFSNAEMISCAQSFPIMLPLMSISFNSTELTIQLKRNNSKLNSSVGFIISWFKFPATNLCRLVEGDGLHLWFLILLQVFV